MSRRAPARWRGDGGQVAGIEAIPFGVLIFVVGTLTITNLWAVVDAKLAVDAAAREAVRTYVEAPDAVTGRQRAEATAEAVVQGHGRQADRLLLTIDHDGGRPFARCVRVRVTARYPVPALQLPWVGGLGPSFEARSTHSERIDPFRSGVPGLAAC